MVFALRFRVFFLQMFCGERPGIVQNSQYRCLFTEIILWESQHSLWILGFEPVEQSVLVEGSNQYACCCHPGTVAVVSLDVGDGVRALHHLNESHLVPGG